MWTLARIANLASSVLAAHAAASATATATALQPFVDVTNTQFQNWFPDRHWAIAIPTFIFIAVIAVTGAFVGLVMIRSGKKKA